MNNINDFPETNERRKNQAKYNKINNNIYNYVNNGHYLNLNQRNCFSASERRKNPVTKQRKYICRQEAGFYRNYFGRNCRRINFLSAHKQDTFSE